MSGTGGGTNVARCSGAPRGPIQFCEVRNSPGAAWAPRPSLRSSPWNLANQPGAIGKLVEPLQAVAHRGDVVDDVANVAVASARLGL